MAEHAQPFDLTDTSELLKLAEEVRRSHQPRVLRHDGEDLALVVPPPSSKPAQNTGSTKTEADYETFRTAIGGWADLDTDALKERIYRAREEGTRPADRP